MINVKCFRHGIIVLFSSLALFSALRTWAMQFVITATNDAAQGHSMTGISTLREAIVAANQLGGNNMIILGRPANRNSNGPMVYHLTVSGADEDRGLTGDLNVTRGNLTIRGVTANVTIDASALGDRIFQVSPHAGLTLDNVTLEGGTAPTGVGIFANGEAGGAIYNGGTLTLESCVITNNVGGPGKNPEGNGFGTEGGDGGGIYNSGSFSASYCIISGNFAGTGVNGAAGGNGGGIRNDVKCNLDDCIIIVNQSGAAGTLNRNALVAGGSGNGAGVYNAGTMTLINCTVGGNICAQGTDDNFSGWSLFGGPGGNGGSGGGIYNVGAMELNFSTVCNNSCGNGGDGLGAEWEVRPGMGGFGGGIFNSSELKLNSSTIYANVCGNGGSGLSTPFVSDTLGVVGQAGGGGGGIYNNGSLESSSCTIAFNQTGFGGNGGNCVPLDVTVFPTSGGAVGGRGGDGGGILNETNSANVFLRNTVVAQNLVNKGGLGGTNTYYQWHDGTYPPYAIVTNEVGAAGPDGIGFDLAGDFTSQKFNLIGMADGGMGFINGVNADHVGSIANPIDPRLGAFQMNGGVTSTLALLWDSPAIDQGNCFGVHTDQRGHARPHDYPLVPNAPGGDGSDIGAYEFDPPGSH